MEEEFVLINPKTKLKTRRKQLHPKEILPGNEKRKTKKVKVEAPAVEAPSVEAPSVEAP